MQAAHEHPGLAAKPSPWTELALTLRSLLGVRLGTNRDVLDRGVDAAGLRVRTHHDR